MIFSFISLKVFLLSMAIGLLFVYLSNPEPTLIYVYPTPSNAGRIEYKDKASNCFHYLTFEILHSEFPNTTEFENGMLRNPFIHSCLFSFCNFSLKFPCFWR